MLKSTHLRGIGVLDVELATDGSVYVLGLGTNPATAGLSVSAGSIYLVSTLTNAQFSNALTLHLTGTLNRLQQGSILSVQTNFGLAGAETSGYLEIDAQGGVQVYKDLRFFSNASTAPLTPGAFLAPGRERTDVLPDGLPARHGLLRHHLAGGHDFPPAHGRFWRNDPDMLR